jgi:hypothetical protein
MDMRQWLLAAAALVGAAGCVGPAPLNLGGSSDAAPPLESGVETPGLAGSWTGYIELETLGDGSDVVALDFTKQADGSYTGTATFGLRPPPPPPDPSVGYLPGVDVFDAGPFTSNFIGRWGFAFTLQNVMFDGVRLQFAVNAPDDMWSSWCAAQLPIDNPSGQPPFTASAGYYCTPAGGSVTTSESQLPFGTMSLLDGGTLTVDVIKYVLCTPGPTSIPGVGLTALSGICRCTAIACAVASNPVRFDMQLGARRIDGSSTLGAVHFVPAQ